MTRRFSNRCLSQMYVDSPCQDRKAHKCHGDWGGTFIECSEWYFVSVSKFNEIPWHWIGTTLRAR